MQHYQERPATNNKVVYAFLIFAALVAIPVWHMWQGKQSLEANAVHTKAQVTQIRKTLNRYGKYKYYASVRYKVKQQPDGAEMFSVPLLPHESFRVVITDF